MRRWILSLFVICFLLLPVSAETFSAPVAPDGALEYMPEDNETFAEGLWYIIKTAVSNLRPELAGASKVCLSIIVAVLLLSIFSSISKASHGITQLVGAVMIGIILLESFHTMIHLGTQTVTELSEYSKLLLPVMTATLAAQGGTTTSAALYTGTLFFNTLLTTAISRLLVPTIYVYLCFCVASSAIDQQMLKKVKDFAKWIVIWFMKVVLYVFTGYIGITGVVSGVVDASALKAAKLTISGVVPVVGGILADASETILLSASVMKSAAGVYGIFAILAICVSPFVQIGAQYLILKLSGAVCGIFGYKPAVDLMNDFSSGMGMLLAMTGSVCVIILVSIVCFMKGVG